MREPPPISPDGELLIRNLLDDCLNPPTGDRHRNLPIVTMWAARGMGQGELLRHLAGGCGGTRPCALVDLDGWLARRPYEVAADLAYQLSARAGQFGRLAFPRLLLGLLAVGGTCTLSDRRAVLDQLRRSLTPARSRVLQRTIRDVASPLVASLVPAPNPEATEYVVGLAVDGMAGVLQTAQRLRAAFNWYRDGLDRRFSDAGDALLHLRHVETTRGAAGRDEVDRALCDALLADLRAQFGGGLRAGGLTGNCLVLLDNADTIAGERFLDVFVAARESHARRDDPACDPLVVVAAGRSRYPVFAEGDGRRVEPIAPEHAGYADWAARKSWLYTVELGGLTSNQLVALARAHRPRLAADEATVTLVGQLTHGHPWGARLALQALGSVGTEAARDVLHEKDPSDPLRSVADAVLDRLLPGASAALVSELTACAAATDLRRGRRLAALGGRPDSECAGFCGRSLLVRDDRLHPLLRRVLLHRLARRTDDGPDWRTVHERLRDYHERRDVALAYHHALAMGDVAAAVDHLDEQVSRLPAEDWLHRLTTITSAPVAPTDHSGLSAQDQFSAWISALPDTVDPALGRLVVGCWLRADCLVDPGHTLAHGIAAELDHLAPRFGAGADVLYEQAQRRRDRTDSCWDGGRLA